MIDRRGFLSLAEGAALTVIASGAKAADTPQNGTIASHEATLAVGGKTISYTARLDSTLLPGASGKPEAQIVTVGYVAHDQNPNRPILFAYNGGPGSASATLQLRVLGPRRLDLPSAPNAPINPPYKLVSNPDSVLPFTDLVMIDPVGSGYSRLFDQSKVTDYYSVDGDGKYLAAFIRQWLIANKRENAPIYILSESYGNMRTVAIVKHLTNDPGLKANIHGLVLLSESIGVLETVQRRTNIVGFAVGLETIAATGWYHKKAETGGMTLDAFVNAAREFATSEYLPALYTGTRLSADKKAAVAHKLARFSGLSPQTWIDADLMVSKEEYRRLLFKDKNLITGLFDTRYLGPKDTYDPALTGVEPALQWAIGTVIKDIGANQPEPYRLSSKPFPLPHWIYAPFSIALTNGDDYRAVDYPQDLMDAMTARPDMRLFICGGYFDTAASIGADEYLLRRNKFPMERVALKHFIGGHMFYTDDESRLEFMRTLRGFITKG